MKDFKIVGYLRKGKSSRFAKTIRYFLKSNQIISDVVMIEGK